MNNTNAKRQQLIDKLKELFQMDQADLDFGIYRIMNAKRDEITRFLNQDLMPTLRQTLEKFQPAGLADKQAALNDAIKAAHTAGFDPDQSPTVKKLRAELEEGIDLEREEETIYSDLTTFFSRYYQGGDFMSLRRYKEGVYALPYEGEEVKLHWANADQYYIKTAENFARYAFKTEQGRVRFELIAASTERDNNKAASDNERRFILAEAPLAIDQDELVIYFEYRPDTKKRKQKELNTTAVESLLALPEGAPLTKGIPQWATWRAALATPQPTEKNKTRPLLEKHLADYTAKNTFDYFIHKDLGKFLRRELDFFIKNEVMHLDDIEEQTAPKVEHYLARIKAMRLIAHKIIAFLAQLENFQKKLWLKKKFVLETQWLITLDRIPESLYAEICEQAEKPVRGWDGRTRCQREEWVELFAIDEIKDDLAGGIAYSIPLTPDFLKTNQSLVLDTAFFREELKQRLLTEITNLDQETNGLLVHGDNFQALNLLGGRYRGKVKCIYIDPPYNTGEDGFPYKDNYQSSSWLTMMSSRIQAAKSMLRQDGIFFCHIDDNELFHLKLVLDVALGKDNFLGAHTWLKRYAPPPDTKDFGYVTEALITYRRSPEFERGLLPMTDEQTGRYINKDEDPNGAWKAADYTCRYTADERPSLYYKITNPNTGEEIWPKRTRVWACSEETHLKNEAEGRVWWGRDGKNNVPALKNYLTKINQGKIPSTLLHYEDVGHTDEAAKNLRDMFPSVKATPKPIRLAKYLAQIANSQNGIFLDFFAGTGSSLHGIIEANRHEKLSRRYVGVEVTDFFDSVLRPRITKAIYSSEWKSGKPISRNGLSQLVKYVRIEGYEDASNNLSLTRTESQKNLVENHSELKSNYVLNYMLDIESRRSLLTLEKFAAPLNVELNIARNNESRVVRVDMVETFNYLLGLHVQTMRRLMGIYEVTGTTPSGDQTLILWRNVNETDNDALDEWFRKQAYNTRDREFDVIYVNGDNNLENLRRADETWKVRLIEEAFHTLMFDMQDI